MPPKREREQVTHILENGNGKVEALSGEGNSARSFNPSHESSVLTLKRAPFYPTKTRKLKVRRRTSTGEIYMGLNHL